VNYNGGDSFMYLIVDGNGGMDFVLVMIVVILVNDVLVVVDSLV